MERTSKLSKKKYKTDPHDKSVVDRNSKKVAAMGQWMGNRPLKEVFAALSDGIKYEEPNGKN